MRRFKIMGLAFVVVLAMEAGVASAALARAPRLTLLSSSGVTWAGETQTAVVIQDCTVTYISPVTNEKPTVSATLGTTSSIGCPTEYFAAEKFSFRKATLSWNGEAKVIGWAQLESAGHCFYRFANLEGTLATGKASASGTTTGYLVSKESNIECAPLATTGWSLKLTELFTGQELLTELRG
jgi:hypothetical protein